MCECPKMERKLIILLLLSSIPNFPAFCKTIVLYLTNLFNLRTKIFCESAKKVFGFFMGKLGTKGIWKVKSEKVKSEKVNDAIGRKKGRNNNTI